MILSVLSLEVIVIALSEIVPTLMPPPTPEVALEETTKAAKPVANSAQEAKMTPPRTIAFLW